MSFSIYSYSPFHSSSVWFNGVTGCYDNLNGWGCFGYSFNLQPAVPMGCFYPVGAFARIPGLWGGPFCGWHMDPISRGAMGVASLAGDFWLLDDKNAFECYMNRRLAMAEYQRQQRKAAEQAKEEQRKADVEAEKAAKAADHTA